MAHTCHAVGCNTAVPPIMFMCKKHWYMVPKSIRERIWTCYRPGQCDDWHITHEYAEVARAGVRYVAQQEGKTEQEIKDTCQVYDMLDPGPSLKERVKRINDARQSQQQPDPG